MHDVCMYYGMCYGQHYFQQSMDQPGAVANSACGQLNRKKKMLPFSVRA